MNYFIIFIFFEINNLYIARFVCATQDAYKLKSEIIALALLSFSVQIAIPLHASVSHPNFPSLFPSSPSSLIIIIGQVGTCLLSSLPPLFYSYHQRECQPERPSFAFFSNLLQSRHFRYEGE
jgi:hypothetical protein